MRAASDPGLANGKPAGGRNGLANCILATAVVAHALLLPLVILPRGKAFDFYWIYQFARVPMTGHSPYEAGIVDDDQHPVFRDAARAQREWFSTAGKVPTTSILSSEKISDAKLALFYPPQAYLIFYPFSRLPYLPALGCWTVFLTLAVLACGSLTWTFDPERRRPLEDCRGPGHRGLSAQPDHRA